MDTGFSSAIHMLILIAESDKPITSEDIAQSVGANAGYGVYSSFGDQKGL